MAEHSHKSKTNLKLLQGLNKIIFLGQYVDLGECLGMADNRIKDKQIITSSFLGTELYPRLKRSNWRFNLLQQKNEIVSIRIIFEERTMIGGIILRCMSYGMEPCSLITHVDIAYVDQQGQERSHYDGICIGENLMAVGFC